MNLTAILVLVSCAATGGTVWVAQDWRYGAKEKERVEQQLELQRYAAKSAIIQQRTVIAAQNEAQARARALRLDADGSRAALVGLYNAADAAMRAAAASHDACLVRADSFRIVLNQCGEAYQELGAVAGRHASDVKTLTDAWPR